MRFVIGAAKRNVEEESGGPFAAAVVEIDTGNRVSIGVNLVASCKSSILHAEIVAIAFAQIKSGTYDLADPALPEHELVTSSEPCSMCFGATLWAGLRHVATGAPAEDARSIGFDEGPKPEKWTEELESRNIRVTTLVERNKAKEILQLYSAKEGLIYNPGAHNKQ
ncbi:MAG: nucleoside deaminase [Prosthecochloris sp.]|nr:nucleoside deaminase [Prosthecochloris sp.]